MKSNSEKWMAVGIDPGARGGMAWTDGVHTHWMVWPIPHDDHALVAAARSTIMRASAVAVEAQQWRGGGDHAKAVSITSLVADAAAAVAWARGVSPAIAVYEWDARRWRRWASVPACPGTSRAAYEERKRQAQNRASDIAGRHVPLRYADAVCIASACLKKLEASQEKQCQR